MIGAVGSGKTTFANHLGVISGLPVYHLDDIVGAAATSESCISAIAHKPAWIVEGVHLGWTDPLLDDADLIVWLDHRNWWQNSVRITRRFIRGALDEVRQQKGVRKFNRFGDYARHLKELVLAIPDARRQQVSAEAGAGGTPTRSEIAVRLAPLHTKVTHCRRASEVQQVLDAFQAQTVVRSRPISSPRR